MSRYTWRDGYTPRRKREVEVAKAEPMTVLERAYIESEVGAVIERILKLKPALGVSVVVIDPVAEAARIMAFGNMSPEVMKDLFSMLGSKDAVDTHVVLPDKPEVAN